LFLQGAEAMHSLDDLTRRTAEPLFRAALERDSTLSQAWVGLGAVLLNRYYEGDFGGLSGLHEAREYFQRGLNLDPTSGPAIRGLVRAYSEAGPIRAGVALVDSLGPLIPNEIERELARGWACAVIGLPDEAVQAMDRVLEVDPRNRGARFYRTFLLWWAGRLSESAEASKSYIRDFGEDADVYAYCGVALAAMTRYDEAIVLLQRSVELFGGNGGAFALIYLAGALHSAGRHSEADSTLAHSLPVYEARLAASPDNMRLRLNLLALYASAKRVHRYDETWKETRRQLQSETSAYPSDVLYVYFALAQVGELERARAVVRFFGAVDADASLLAHAGAAPERIWNGNFTNEFLRSLEFVQLRTGIPAFRERIRSQFAWVAGAAEPANQKSRRGVALGSTR
jgi:tetratricopeptide (TPR) repeat protein